MSRLNLGAEGCAQGGAGQLGVSVHGNGDSTEGEAEDEMDNWLVTSQTAVSMNYYLLLGSRAQVHYRRVGNHLVRRSGKAGAFMERMIGGRSGH